MAGRRDRLSGEPTDEPAWMREVGRGGDPTVHGRDGSWPAAGVAAYIAQKTGRGITQTNDEPVRPATNLAGKSRSAIARNGHARRETPRAGKGSGGCSCGGAGNCKSERGGGGCPGYVGSREVRGRAVDSVEATPNKTADIPGLVAAVRANLAAGGVVMTEAELTEIVKKAMSSRPSSRHRRSNSAPATVRGTVNHENLVLP